MGVHLFNCVISKLTVSLRGTRKLSKGRVKFNYPSLKGLRIANMNFFILAPAQTNRMEPILVSCEAPFESNFQRKHWSRVRVMTLTGPLVQ